MALFKFINPDLAAAGTSDQDGLSRWNAAFHKNITWASLLPTIEAAELIYIRDEIGLDLYDSLTAAYDAYPATAMSTANAAMIRKLQRALSYFVQLEALKNPILVAEMGPRETGDTEGASTQPRQWVLRQAMEAAATNGYRFLNDALRYLYTNAASYSVWTASQTYDDQLKLYISDPQHFADHLVTEVPWVVFRRMRPAIERAERLYILPVLGDELNDELKTAINARSETSAQKALLYEIRRALAQYAMRYALPGLRLHLTPDGLVIPEYSDGITSRKPAADGAGSVNALTIDLETAAATFLVELKSYLLKNQAAFPTWRDSTASTRSTPFHGLIPYGTDGHESSVVSIL